MLKEIKKYIELKKEEQRIKDSRLQFYNDVLNSSEDDFLFNFMLILCACLEYFITRYSSGTEGFFFWINIVYLFMIFPFIFKNTLLVDYIKPRFSRKKSKERTLIKNEINNLKNIIIKEKELQIDSLENHYESHYLKELNQEIFTIEYIREILINEKNGVKDKKIQIETS